MFGGFGKWALRQDEERHAGRIHTQDVRPLPLVAGKPSGLNVYFQNIGDSPVEYQGFSAPHLVPNLSRALLQTMEETYFKELREIANANSGQVKVHTIPAHGSFWNTLPTPPILEEKLADIKNGNALIMTVSIMKYKNGPKRPDVELCALWGRDEQVVQECPTHNVE